MVGRRLVVVVCAAAFVAGAMRGVRAEDQPAAETSESGTVSGKVIDKSTGDPIIEAVVKDTVSAETIAKSPDKDAASVVKRVPAVTIKEGKFVFVRGLGERYSSALLDGSRLPSTDPSKRVVPLDLFPAEFLESLGIVK